MKRKNFLVSILLLVLINFSLYAGVGLDIGLNYDSQEIDENGVSVDREYPFSLVALPSFTSDVFSMELNVPLYFKIDPAGPDIEIDYSAFELPASEGDLIKDALNYSDFFLSYINYIQLFDFNEDFALRLGKIANSTIGNGALLYHYGDSNVTKFETRPGFQLKFDANTINLPISTEFITTDMFNPDLIGGRIGVNPLFIFNSKFLSNISLGYTLMYHTEYNNSANNWYDFAYDLQVPLFKNGTNSLIIYYDLISEVDTNRQLSQRVGLYGWYFDEYTYNVHIKNIIDDNATFVDLESANLDLLEKTIIPQFKPDFIISGNTGYYSNNGLSDFILESELEFKDVKLNSYNLGLRFSSDKAIGPVNSMAIDVSKGFVKDDLGQFSEEFLEGFTTFKNFTASLTASVILYQVNEIEVNLNLVGDADGKLEKPTYSIGYKFSL